MRLNSQVSNKPASKENSNTGIGHALNQINSTDEDEKEEDSNESVSSNNSKLLLKSKQIKKKLGCSSKSPKLVPSQPANGGELNSFYSLASSQKEFLKDSKKGKH